MLAVAKVNSGLPKAYKGAIYSPEYLFPVGVLVSIPRRMRGIAMKSYARSKLSASLVVLVMALSAILVVVPGQIAGQTSSGVNIYVPVAVGGTPVTGATVNLTEVHTGALIPLGPLNYSVSRTSYVAANPAPGLYRIDVSAPNYYTQPSAAYVNFTGLKNVTVNPIMLTGFPAKTSVYTVKVVSGVDGTAVMGATVGFYNTSHRQFVSVGQSNSTGYVVLTMYKTNLITDVSLVVIKGNFETNSTALIVAGNNTVSMTVTLSASKKVSAFVTDSNNIPALSVVAYLINTDPSVVWVKRVLRATGNLFSFDAYSGTFTLVIASPGSNSKVLTGISPPTGLMNIQLDKQTQRTEQLDLTFDTNYSQFLLEVSTQWSYDDAYPGLMMNDMGSLRAQVDLVMGDGNGILSSGEITAFNTALTAFGTQYVTSKKLLTVNSTVFTNGTATDMIMDLAAGNVDLKDKVNYSYQCIYTANAAVRVGASRYSLNATANLANANVEYNYTLALVNHTLAVGGYVLVHNVTPPGGIVTGYKVVNYTSNVMGTGSELIQLTVELSKRPTAIAGVTVPAKNASSVLNATKVLQRYIVRAQANVTFNATRSADPNGNPLTFIWNFNDSTPLVTTTNETVVHNFSSAFKLSHINLTVMNQGGETNYTEIKVTCDGIDPTPVISAHMGRTVASAGQIMVNQSELVVFNANKSYDDAVVQGENPAEGVIDHVEYNYGDNSTSGPIAWTAEQNRSHAYANAGTYTVTLKAFDVVGHNKTTTLQVVVNDTTAPSVKFTYKNTTGGLALTENSTVSFSANGTTDNVDRLLNLSFSWDFGDKLGAASWDNSTGANVTHTYAKIGSFTVTLKVTDRRGNNATSKVTIDVASSPRPKLVISVVTYDPQNFTQGKTGYIVVNITNTGNAVATDVLVQFFIVPDNGGPLQKLGDTNSITNATSGLVVTSIDPGGKVQVRFAYSPSGTGTITLKINVTAKDQLTPYSFTASGNQALHVKESALTALLLWIGVAVIIVAIPSLLYVRSRWMKREKRGPRRERKETKEKEPKEDEEL